jgi:hypothetical protein
MLPRIDELNINGQMFLIALAIAGLASVLFGLAPALYVSRRSSRSAISAGLSSRAHTSAIPGSRIRSVLLVSQLVLATTLLVGAGLFLRSFVALVNVNVGFDPRQPPPRMCPTPR